MDRTNNGGIKMTREHYTVEVHIGKDVLSCASHVEEETAMRQAKRLEAAGQIARIWFQKRLIYKTND